MSFLTSFWLFPQKEQERLPWSSRLRSFGTEENGSTRPAPAARPGASYRGDLLAARSAQLLDQDVVDQAVLLGLDRAHEVVALGIRLDALDRLAGVLHQQLVQLVARPEDLLGVDVDVRGLPREATERLVDQDARVRQREALALRARGQQERAHR